jgi:hypothetical protein
MDSAERALYAHDASVLVGGVSGGSIFFPVNALEVQSIARICAAHGRSIVPRGAGTGFAGGAIPLGAPVVVVTTKMTKILEIYLENRVAWIISHPEQSLAPPRQPSNRGLEGTSYACAVAQRPRPRGPAERSDRCRSGSGMFLRRDLSLAGREVFKLPRSVGGEGASLRRISTNLCCPCLELRRSLERSMGHR